MPQQPIAGRYRLVRPLGQGGQGRVWLARDEMLRRDVAIKELVPPAGLTEAEQRDLRERSMREARTIARIDQANVVRIFDVLHSGGKPWIVMEFVAARPLHQVLSQQGPMTPGQAARVGLSVLAALRAAHGVGVLHRDVKPANVLLARDGRVVLTDFGLATAAEDPSLTQTGVVLGSPAFLAPERALDQPVGPASDLWSLGAMLYAAVEGRSPYQRSSSIATLAALSTELPPAPERAGPLLPALEGLLRRDPRARIDAETAERLLRAATIADEPGGPGSAGPGMPGMPSGTGGSGGPGFGVPLGTSGSGGSGGPGFGVPLGTSGSGGSGGPGFGVPLGTSGSGEPGGTGTGVLPAASETFSGGNPQPAPVHLPGQAFSGATPSRAEPAPDSVPGKPPLPAAALPAVAPRRSRRLLAGASAVLALLVAGAAVVLLKPGLLDTNADAARQPSVPSTSAQPSPGWHYYQSDPGFSVPVPDGWEAVRDGRHVEFREPDGQRSLSVDELVPVPANFGAAARKREEAAGKSPGYRRIVLGAVSYQARAVEHEWTWTAAGTRMHAVSRAFVTAGGRAYVIDWRTPDAVWVVNRPALALVFDGFRATPAGAAPASGQARPLASATARPAKTTVASKPTRTRTAGPAATTPAATGEPLKNLGTGTCVDVPDGDPATTAPLQVWSCHDGAGQRFTVPGDGTVRVLGKCLRIDGTADGSTLSIGACTGGAGQQFDLNASYDLVSLQVIRCVEVPYGDPADGVLIRLIPCGGESHQKWSLG